MIKVGDHIRLKKNVHPDYLETLKLTHPFPFKVKDIRKCDTKENGSNHICCKECPGYIDGGACLGRVDNDYPFESFSNDWDE